MPDMHGSTPNRLPAMLFLAALIHGILIIGITFNPMQPSGDSGAALSFDVTIIGEPTRQMPDTAEYLAQADHDSDVDIDPDIDPDDPLLQSAATPTGALPDLPGDAAAMPLPQYETGAEPLLANHAATTAAALSATQQPLAPGQTPLPLAADPTGEPRQLVIDVDTRESVVAVYLANWKRRIEAAGAAYIGTSANMQTLSGSPTLEVSIDSSGHLMAVVIRRSSGSPILDQAALNILQHAAPFAPFPAEISAEYDSLRFAYKWLFGGQPAPTASQTAAPQPTP